MKELDREELEWLKVIAKYNPFFEDLLQFYSKNNFITEKQYERLEEEILRYEEDGNHILDIEDYNFLEDHAGESESLRAIFQKYKEDGFLDDSDFNKYFDIKLDLNPKFSKREVINNESVNELQKEDGNVVISKRNQNEPDEIRELIAYREQTQKISYPKLCPKCNKKLVIYIGKNGAFFGCNGYPNCRFSFNIDNIKNILCPDCGSSMYERTGSRGIFLGCGGYPDCRFTYPIRISKNVKSIKTPVKSQRKKLEFDEKETLTNLSDEKILQILSKDWETADQLANKLGLAENTDIKFLVLKLKQLVRKNIISTKNVDNIDFWRTSEKRKSKNKRPIIVLELENNKWWIGSTKDPSTTIAAHKEGKGNAWTKKNKVIKVAEIIEEGNLTEIMVKYINKYGWNRVRGTNFSVTYNTYIPKKIQEAIKNQKGGAEFLKSNEDRTRSKHKRKKS